MCSFDELNTRAMETRSCAVRITGRISSPREVLPFPFRRPFAPWTNTTPAVGWWAGGPVGGGLGGLARPGLEGGRTELSVPLPLPTELDVLPEYSLVREVLPPRGMGEMTRWQAPGIQMGMAV